MNPKKLMYRFCVLSPTGKRFETRKDMARRDSDDEVRGSDLYQAPTFPQNNLNAFDFMNSSPAVAQSTKTFADASS
jgi:hypothetical protein